MKPYANFLALLQNALSKKSKLITSLDNIHILVNDGAVIMPGSAERSLKTLARRIVSSVPGVNLLIDDPKVEPAPPTPRGCSDRLGKRMHGFGGRPKMIQRNVMTDLRQFNE